MAVQYNQEVDIINNPLKIECSVPGITNTQIESSLQVGTGGSGYTSAPTVTISPPESGTQATATASLAGPITGIVITNSGTGYTSASVSFSGGGGTVAAEATPTINNGQITAILINSGGNYNSPPTVTISGNGSGASAQATMSVTSLTVTNSPSGYTSNPTVTISAPTTANGVTATAYALANSNGTVTLVFNSFPEGSSVLSFVDTSSGNYTDLFLVTDSSTGYTPLLTTSQGVMIKKDLEVGGWIDVGQGAISLNYGFSGSPAISSPPCIIMASSSTPYPSGTSLPGSPQNGQLFSQNGVLQMWNGSSWITGNFTGYYDTLFLFQANGANYANLDLGTLIVNGQVLYLNNSTAKILFNNDPKADLYYESSGLLMTDGSLDVGTALWTNTLAVGSSGAFGVNASNQVVTKNNILDDSSGNQTISGQIKLTGGAAMLYSTGDNFIGSGMYYNGLSWIATSNNGVASGIKMFTSVGYPFELYYNTGLTQNQSFSPALIAYIDGSGNLAVTSSCKAIGFITTATNGQTSLSPTIGTTYQNPASYNITIYIQFSVSASNTGGMAVKISPTTSLPSTAISAMAIYGGGAGANGTVIAHIPYGWYYAIYNTGNGSSLTNVYYVID